MLGLMVPPKSTTYRYRGLICSITIPLLESEAVILSIDVLTCTVSFSDVTKWNWLPVYHSNQTLSSLGITGQNSNELKCITHNYFNLLKKAWKQERGSAIVRRSYFSQGFLGISNSHSDLLLPDSDVYLTNLTKSLYTTINDSVFLTSPFRTLELVVPKLRESSLAINLYNSIP